MFEGFLNTSMIKRGISKNAIDIEVIDLREFSFDKRGTVDGKPFGGGPGMIVRVDVVDSAISNTKCQMTKPYTILLTPQGKKFDQKKAIELSREREIILICGHYEGFDERIRDLVDEEISIGDYVLTGGELPAMVIIDAISRHIAGFLGKDESSFEESFSNNLLEYPQYTQPRNYNGKQVPEILLSGNHQRIAKWRQEQAIGKTQKRRPDMI